MANLAMPVVAISMLANVFGNQSLAYLLTSGVVKSIFLAVVVVTMVMIVETLATSISRVPRIAEIRFVSRHGDKILARLPRVLGLIGAVLFIAVSLSYFKILQMVEDRLHAMLTFRIQVGSLDISAMDLILFVLALYISVLVSRAVRFVLEEEVFPRVELPRGLPNTVSMLVNYGILALGFFVAVSAAGLDLSRFAILAGALGVGIGFGMQNVVNNFISGIILAFERPIQVGDTIEVGQLVGRVKRIGFRSSTVRTYEGAEVIVPNGNLISAEVVNWTLSDRLRRIDIAVGVAYGSDPGKVLQLLEEVAKEHKEILSHPPPSIIFLGFGESSLDFSARVWTAEFEEWLRIRSDVSVKIYKALHEAGIEIPFPQRDLHLRSVDRDIVLSPRQGNPSVAAAEKTD
jgi:small-conductance mechanosensitive channel